MTPYLALIHLLGFSGTQYLDVCCVICMHVAWAVRSMVTGTGGKKMSRIFVPTSRLDLELINSSLVSSKHLFQKILQLQGSHTS
ncbi:hypothetical protein BJ878DRAFT_491092 [Calycina marina]|uniref:Uncharacterized protein n=1 Tax=Calycina marina TaxID=1763456 RepID=A0A9P7Z9X7_9HELO|nr:hypothetical protein BJ878DRAFT_491092 [Calycina marina]